MRAEPQIVKGRHFVVDERTGCWEWLGFRLRGYARHRRGAHRMVWEQRIGPIPDGHDLHHECENPGCVNPAHMKPREFIAHRTEHAHAKRLLTLDQAREVRRLAEDQTLTFAAIAELTGVTEGTVQSIAHGKRYAELGGRVLPDRVCGYCSEPIEGGRRDARYCCPTHRKYASRDRRAMAVAA